MKYVTIEIISGETTDTIKIEEALFTEFEKVCISQGLTAGQALELFIKHVAEHGVPFTWEEIQAYQEEQAHVDSKLFNMPTIETMKRISAEYLTEHFDEAMELCHTENAICIEREGEPDCVLMTAEAYEAWTGEKVVIPDDYKDE